jgi:hypothetical protein
MDGADWTVVLHPCYDRDLKGGKTFIQHLQCPQCGNTFAPDKAGDPVPMSPAGGMAPAMASDMPMDPNMAGAGSPMPLPVGAPPELPQEPQMSEASCPNCHGPIDASNMARDEKGKPKGEEFPKGKMKLEVFSPFEAHFDLEARPGDEQEILIRRRYSLDYIQQRFGKYDLEADNNSNVGGGIGLNLLRAIAYASGGTSTGSGIASGRNLDKDQSITVDTLWKRPCADFPEGLVAIYAQERLLNDGKGTDENYKEGIPYKTQDGETIWPFEIIPFDEVPGRAYGRTPMDDVAPKQEQRNRIESLIQLIITRTGNPVWLIAKGTGVTELTGEPGQTIEGNWAMDPKLRPERVSGENVPTSIIAFLEKIDSDMEEISGVFDVLRGNAPNGITAGTALRLLLERANTRFTPVLTRYEKAWERVCNHALTIFQQFASEERINKIQGPGNTWEVQRFKNSDLRGAVDIIVEAGSAIPKSTVGEQALIQDLIGGGIIDPTNPETQYKILERFGSTGLLGDTDLNIRYAQRETWDFVNEGKQPEINPILDFHPAHIMVHKQYALTSDFSKMDKSAKTAFEMHILEHQMAMMPPALPAGPPPSGKGNSPAPTDQGSAQGQKGGSGQTPPGQSSVPPSSNAAQDTGEPPLFPGV